MNYRSAIVTLLLAATPAASADTLFGLYVGAGGWKQDFSGDVASGVTDIDVGDDLGLEEETNNLLYIAIEHGVPALPNIRLQHMNVDVTGANVLTRTIDFNGTVFSVSDAIDTDVDVKTTDAVFYYELLDNVFSLDLGMAARHMDGYVNVESSVEFARADFDGFIPMVYGAARVDLPLTGLWVAASGMGIAFSGDTLIDVNAHVGYESDIGLGVELGWRSLRFEMEEFDDIDVAELDVSGPYAALNFHF